MKSYLFRIVDTGVYYHCTREQTRNCQTEKFNLKLTWLGGRNPVNTACVAFCNELSSLSTDCVFIQRPGVGGGLHLLRA